MKKNKITFFLRTCDALSTVSSILDVMTNLFFTVTLRDAISFYRWGNWDMMYYMNTKYHSSKWKDSVLNSGGVWFQSKYSELLWCTVSSLIFSEHKFPLCWTRSFQGSLQLYEECKVFQRSRISSQSFQFLLKVSLIWSFFPLFTKVTTYIF